MVPTLYLGELRTATLEIYNLFSDLTGFFFFFFDVESKLPLSPFWPSSHPMTQFFETNVQLRFS